MVNDFFKKLIDETPRDVQIFVDKYEEISMRIHQLLKSKGMSQKDLAQSLEKRPSEISKWLNEGHNLTLKTIAKIEAVLGEDIINVPLRQSFDLFDAEDSIRGKMSFTVYKNNKPNVDNLEMTELTPKIFKKIA